MDVIRSVLLRPAYAGIAFGVAVVVFTFSIWLPNWRLILTVIPSSIISLPDKVILFWNLYGSIQTNFTLVSASYTIAIAILFGINIVLFIHYIKIRQGPLSGSTSALGVGGLISGFFGVGCAACGTFILTALLGLVGGAGLITLLPLGGEEFGILGVALLGYAMYSIIKKIKEPLVCDTIWPSNNK